MDFGQSFFDGEMESVLPEISPIYRLKDHPTWRDLGMTDEGNDETLSYIPELPLEPLLEGEFYQQSKVLNDVIVLTKQGLEETSCDVVVCPVTVPEEKTDVILTGQDTLDIDQFVGSTIVGEFDQQDKDGDVGQNGMRDFDKSNNNNDNNNNNNAAITMNASHNMFGNSIRSPTSGTTPQLQSHMSMDIRRNNNNSNIFKGEDVKTIKDNVSLSLKYSALPKTTLNFIFSHNIVLQMLRAHKSMRAHEIVEIDLRARLNKTSGSNNNNSSISGITSGNSQTNSVSNSLQQIGGWPQKEVWLYALDDRRVHMDSIWRQNRRDSVCTSCQSITYHIGSIVSKFLNKKYKTLLIPIPACFYSTDSNIHRHVREGLSQDDSSSTICSPRRNILQNSSTIMLGGQNTNKLTKSVTNLENMRSKSSNNNNNNNNNEGTNTGAVTASTRSNNTSGDGLTSEDLTFTLNKMHTLVSDEQNGTKIDNNISGINRIGGKPSSLHFDLLDLQPTLQIAYSLGEIDFVTNLACVVCTIRKVLENAYNKTRAQGKNYTVFDASVRIGLSVDMDECIKYIDRKTQLAAPASKRYSTLSATVYMLIEKVIARYFPRGTTTTTANNDNYNDMENERHLSNLDNENTKYKNQYPESYIFDSDTSSDSEKSSKSEQNLDDEKLKLKIKPNRKINNIDDPLSGRIRPQIENVFESSSEEGESNILPINTQMLNSQNNNNNTNNIKEHQNKISGDNLENNKNNTEKEINSEKTSSDIQNNNNKEDFRSRILLENKIFPQSPSFVAKNNNSRNSSSLQPLELDDIKDQIPGTNSCCRCDYSNNSFDEKEGNISPKNGIKLQDNRKCNTDIYPYGNERTDTVFQSIFTQHGYKLNRERIEEYQNKDFIEKHILVYEKTPSFVSHVKKINKVTIIKEPPIDALSIMQCREKTIQAGGDITKLMDCSRVNDFSKIDTMGGVIHCPPTEEVASATVVVDKLPRKEKGLEMVLAYLMRLIPYVRDNVPAPKIILILLLGQANPQAPRSLPKCTGAFLKRFYVHSLHSIRGVLVGCSWLAALLPI